MKKKLMFTLVMMVAVPVLLSVIASTWLAQNIAGDLLIKEAEQKLVSIRVVKKRAIEDYFEQTRQQIITLANTENVIGATRKLNKAYLGIKKSPGKSIGPLRSELENYYRENASVSNDVSDFSGIVKNISDHAVVMHTRFIRENPNPRSERFKLNVMDESNVAHGGLKRYNLTHRKYHEQFIHFMQNHGYQDILIANAQTGDIIYSVQKQPDYFTSLIDGPYSKTAIGDAFRAITDTEFDNPTYINDLSFYAPQSNLATQFIAAPIMDRDKKVGVLIISLSVDRLNTVMTGANGWQHDGLGETGESYLVGADAYMRSNGRSLIEHPEQFLAHMQQQGIDAKTVSKMQRRKSTILLQKVDSNGVDSAFKGDTGFDIFNDYRGEPVLSAFDKLNIPGLDWVIMSEMDEDEAYAPASSLSTRLLIGSILVAIVLLGLAMFLGWWVTSRLANPIHRLEREIQGIESESDLSIRLRAIKGEVTGGIATSLNNMLEKLHGIILMMSTSSTSMTEASSNMTEISTATNRDVTRQNEETDQVAREMEKLSATVSDVSTSANEASNAAMEANTQATQGNQVVLSATNSIKQLAGEVHQASDVITQLANEANNIGSVLDVIRGIAEQTNLLALNAAIEAARAGEQGRGFAVVADEVRTLASRTQESTAEIQTMIEGLQSGTRDAVQVMEIGQQQAEVSVSQANEAASALSRITDSIELINNMNQRIVEISHEQLVVTDNVCQSVTRISEISASTTTNAQRTESAGIELDRLSRELNVAVDQFSL